MTWPIVLCCVLAALLTILLLPAGGVFEYHAAGSRVQAVLGPLRVTVYPLPKWARSKPGRPKKQKKAKKQKADADRGGNLPFLLELLEVASKTADDARRKLRIDLLYIDYTAAASDPASAALQFGGASAALGTLLAMLENLVTVKDRRITTRVDFSLEKPELYLKAGGSIRIGHALYLSLVFLFRFYPIYRRNRKRSAAARAQRSGGNHPAGEAGALD